MESEPAPASTENSEFSHIPTDGSLYPPSETIYIRNLSEKVKIGGNIESYDSHKCFIWI